MFDVTAYLPASVVAAVILTVVSSELVKKLDKKERLRGFRVWLPLIFSLIFTASLALGGFFALRESFFYGAAIFGFSVFFYEAIVKHLKNAFEDKKE